MRKLAPDRKSAPVLGYAEPRTADRAPTPPLHFWIRLIVFASVAAALAWPLLVKS